MKQIQFIVNCLTTKIKNYFFIGSKTDISQDCENLFSDAENQDLTNELKCTKEYLENYQVTTRWQTL